MLAKDNAKTKFLRNCEQVHNNLDFIEIIRLGLTSKFARVGLPVSSGYSTDCKNILQTTGENTSGISSFNDNITKNTKNLYIT